jgi:hypothetical protein
MEATKVRDQLVDLIVQRLSESKEQFKRQFLLEHPIKVAHHFVLDNFLPTEIAQQVCVNFPKPSQMRLINSLVLAS